MNTWEHRWVGPLMHDRIIGALELCCRLSEMLLIQNKRVDWDTHTIGVPGHTTKDKQNRRIPFDSDGRLAAILRRRGKLGPEAFVFGTDKWRVRGQLQDGLGVAAPHRQRSRHETDETRRARRSSHDAADGPALA